MYIKDMISGKVRKYGTNPHDSLRVSPDGRYLTYYNLQNGDGSFCGGYRFCDENGVIPEDDEVLAQHGADAYFNIGGFDEYWKRLYEDARYLLRIKVREDKVKFLRTRCPDMTEEQIEEVVGTIEQLKKECFGMSDNAQKDDRGEDDGK